MSTPYLPLAAPYAKADGPSSGVADGPHSAVKGLCRQCPGPPRFPPERGDDSSAVPGLTWKYAGAGSDQQLEVDRPHASVQQQSSTAAVNVGLRALIAGLGHAVGRSRRDGDSW